MRSFQAKSNVLAPSRHEFTRQSIDLNADLGNLGPHLLRVSAVLQYRSTNVKRPYVTFITARRVRRVSCGLNVSQASWRS